jgi:hypothetical protein
VLKKHTTAKGKEVKGFPRASRESAEDGKTHLNDERKFSSCDHLLGFSSLSLFRHERKTGGGDGCFVSFPTFSTFSTPSHHSNNLTDGPSAHRMLANLAHGRDNSH